MARKNLIMVDLEGTLSNCAHRVHHLKSKEYDLWNEGLHEDEPNTSIIALVAALSVMYPICVATAKPCKYYHDIIKWLHNHTSFDYMLMMRPEGCAKSSVEVKRFFLDAVWREKYHVLLGIDDRPNICEMYTKNNIQSLLVGDETTWAEIQQKATLTIPQNFCGLPLTSSRSGIENMVSHICDTDK